MMQMLYKRDIHDNYKNNRTIAEIFHLEKSEVTLSDFLTR